MVDNHFLGNSTDLESAGRFRLLKKSYSLAPHDSEESDWQGEVKSTKTFHIKEFDLSVFDVANYILNSLGEMTTMKLHKLLYYSQAWSLVWDEKPLFKDPIEAWANGPVVRSLFAFHRGKFTISTLPVGNPDLLNEDQRNTVNSVLEYYGPRTTQWLIELTHLESPWKNARVGLSPNDRGNKEISWQDMALYYSSL